MIGALANPPKMIGDGGSLLERAGQPVKWHPALAHRLLQRPQPGDLIAYEHAVWRVAEVTDVALDGQELDAWVAAGAPQHWASAPYDVVVDHVAGHRPPWDRTGRAVIMRRPWVHPHDRQWHVYPRSGRWPQCSCCGEPVPCRAELQDREIAAGIAVVEKWSSRLPGCCWACGETITSRQKTISYPGENVDIPGGMVPVFHLRRRACFVDACAYERRWLTGGHRQRMLTWPQCGGGLTVHWDGSSECEHAAAGCQGHLTHDHGSVSACFVGGPCPRGCPAAGHPGTRFSPRPPRISGAKW